MKNILSKICIAAVASLVIASCSKLEEKPYSFFTPDQFYQSGSDAEAGLTSVYGSLAQLYTSVMWQLSDYSADQMFPRAVVNRDQIAAFTYDANSEFVATYWNSCYAGINNANTLLANIDKVAMDENRKKQIKAEAYFLRGLFYFSLAKAFGQVPVHTEPVTNIANTEKQKSTEAEVYAQVISDLVKAETDLPLSPTQKGRTSKAATLALEAKVFLYMKNYTKSAAKANELLSAPGTFGLVNDVIDLWDVEKEDASRKENIFAVEFSREPNLRSTIMIGFFAPGGSAPLFTNIAFGSQFAYLQFYASFNNNDRRKLLMDTFYINTAGQRIGQSNNLLKGRAFIRKYFDRNSNGANGENNYPIVRFADVLLIYAEAEARQNGPSAATYNAVNQVRRRAFGQPLNQPSQYDLPAGVSKDDFVNAVLQERSFELCFESDRWYDLTRTNAFLSVGTVTNAEYPVRNVQPKHRFFPVPLNEVLTNSKIEQNPLWK